MAVQREAEHREDPRIWHVRSAATGVAETAGDRRRSV
jgi:hypothetical protein